MESKNYGRVKLKNLYNGRPESLCSFCAKACVAGCSWAEDFTPVKHWIAVPNDNGWYVMDCPEFKSDENKALNPNDLDTEGCIRLLEAVMKSAREDYMSCPAARPGIEAFFRNRRLKHLFFFAEPAMIIRQLRKEAQNAREKPDA